MEKSSKLAKIVLWALMIISVIIFVFMFASIDSETNPGQKARNLMALNINWSIVLFAIAAITSLGFAVIQMAGDKSQAIGALIVLLIFAVIVGVSYSMATSEMPKFFGVDKFIADGVLTPSITRWIGAGLYVTYILFAGAFLSIIGFSVASIVKR
jgi:hypothetical protein